MKQIFDLPLTVREVKLLLKLDHERKLEHIPARIRDRLDYLSDEIEGENSADMMRNEMEQALEAEKETKTEGEWIY